MEESGRQNPIGRSPGSRRRYGTTEHPSPPAPPTRTTGASPRYNRSHRVAPPHVIRNASYLDDIALNAMINSGMLENIGPQILPQFRMPIYHGSDYFPAQDSFERHVESLGWMQKKVSISKLPDKAAAKAPSYIDIDDDEGARLKKDPRFLIPRLETMEDDQNDEKRRQVSEQRKETILEWFDRSVEKELKKRKEQMGKNSKDDRFPEAMPVKDLYMSRATLERMSEASASRIELAQQLMQEPTTELTDAVDKYAKAEAMCSFAGAVKAAEAAAEAAPPGLAEEAAVASAKVFQTEGEQIKETFQGLKPIEVIGYVGVTKPRHPVKPKK